MVYFHVVSPSWWDRRCPLSTALLPLGAAYAGGALLREVLARPRRAPVPTVCAGTVLAGGSGKTPVAIAISERLAATRPTLAMHFLTRGYGGTERGPLRVDAAHEACAVGDEALLLAGERPTWVATQRLDGALAAAAAGAELVVMDDGLQHHAMVRDVSLLCVDARYLLGNGRVVPAGPLREPLARALSRADAVVAVEPFDADAPRAGELGAIGADENGGSERGVAAETALRSALAMPWAMPLLRAQMVPEPAAAASIAGRRVLAFSGTARPGRFFASLRALGCDVVGEVALPDHAPLPEELVARLVADASGRGAELVTTCKDAARLPTPSRRLVHTLPMRLHWLPGSAEVLDGLLECALHRWTAAAETRRGRGGAPWSGWTQGK